MEIVFNVETDGLPRDEIQHLMPEFSARVITRTQKKYKRGKRRSRKNGSWTHRVRLSLGESWLLVSKSQIKPRL